MSSSILYSIYSISFYIGVFKNFFLKFIQVFFSYSVGVRKMETAVALKISLFWKGKSGKVKKGGEASPWNKNIVFNVDETQE